ncbi:RHS repeat-associated core domain-containing protein [Chryseobacterium culicis]|uniref:RHS repeat-associated core domain-containing protein n=1 Tax=Chryseobacterium culicis TaxID=680127 RepID=UPI0018746E1B|nr:RHS repeat-associated core domain-containing protein [Chryseobacterium culicis]MBE4949347.1 hypothetical protein [Chryseobacterium culicis]
MGFQYSNFKYNGKELQETGLFDYGWRQYMPDLGRWNGIDQLAESYLSTSPFAYVANNPVSSFDVDGRWMDDSGHIIDTTGQTFGFLGSSYKPQGATNYLGVKYGDGGGNGSYTPFGRTQAYADLMTAFYNGGTGGMSNIGGTLRWWTDYKDPDPTVTGVGAFGMLKLKGNASNSNSTSNSLLDNIFNWIQGNPIKVSQFAGMIQAGSTIAEKGLSNWNGASNITKSRIFTETISTKLPLSAKALETTSTALKWGGRVVGAVGLANTLYQYGKGNISGTRAIVDGVMGVAGFFPATAWISVGYFVVTALYETYGNDGKPLF